MSVLSENGAGSHARTARPKAHLRNGRRVFQEVSGTAKTSKFGVFERLLARTSGFPNIVAPNACKPSR